MDDDRLWVHKKVIARMVLGKQRSFCAPLEAERTQVALFIAMCKHMPGKLSLSRQWHSWTWNVMFLV